MRYAQRNNYIVKSSHEINACNHESVAQCDNLYFVSCLIHPQPSNIYRCIRQSCRARFTGSARKWIVLRSKRLLGKKSPPFSSSTCSPIFKYTDLMRTSEDKVIWKISDREWRSHLSMTVQIRYYRIKKKKRSAEHLRDWYQCQDEITKSCK